MHRLAKLALVAWLGAMSTTTLAAPFPTLSLTEFERGIRESDPEAAKHLRITELSVEAKVVGRVADISLDMLISSDADENYEANLGLTLPIDAVITGYALNVGNTLIPGELLEQPKARNIYEDELRGGVDPGLAEVSSGNRFTTRIFPINKGSPRRIRISFSAPFDPEAGFLLPLDRDVPVGKVSINVIAFGYERAPTIRFTGKPVPLVRTSTEWHGSASHRDASHNELEIVGGSLSRPMLVAQHASGEQFFLINDTVAKPSRPHSSRRLRIYWDRSLSHGRDNLMLETEVLARFIEKSAPAAIDLVTFASDKPGFATFSRVDDLRQALSRITYRGGTSLAGLDALALKPAASCIMVFDGHVTIDRGAQFAPDCAVVVATSSMQADGARLGRIAESTGGKLVRVAEGGVAEAAAAFTSSTTVNAVFDTEGRRISFRALPTARGQWMLAGKMPDRGAIRVSFSDGTRRSYSREGVTTEANAPGALWAAQQVHALDDDPSRHANMVAFARRYQVAGPAMSFLVLERPDQYLRAGLAPPTAFSKEWLSDYRELRKEHDAEELNARRERFDHVLQEWTTRKTWWAKRFTTRRTVAPKRGGTSAPPPPVVAAPMPAPAIHNSPTAVGEVSTEDGGDVIVTGLRRSSDVPVSDEGHSGGSREIKIDLADVASKRPYILALNSATTATRMKVLAAQEREFGTLPGFYLDTAEWFRLKADVGTANLLLLSALELPLSDDETRQIVAFRLERDRAYDRAVEIAEHLAAANAEFRPQPGRALALALAARGRSRAAAGRADLERAFHLLVDTALNPASGDFDGIEVIALMEANALIPDIKAAGGTWDLDQRLVALLDTDARIVIEWTADDADIDLWVDEPNDERVYYGTKLSSAGGQISNDMTDGYGPEEYAIHRAPPGAYAVRVNGYDADRLNPNGPGHVLVRLTRNFARPSQRDSMLDLDLSFQQGRSRDNEEDTRPVAVLRVEK